MTLVAACQCGQRFAANPQYAGKTLPCPACGRALTVPLPKPDLAPLGDDLFADLNQPQPGQAAAPASGGLPPYQPGQAMGATVGLSTNAKLLIGGAAGGALLIVGVVVGVLLMWLGSSGRKQGPTTAFGPQGPPPGFYGPPPGYGAPPGFGAPPHNYPSHGPGYPAQPSGYPSQPGYPQRPAPATSPAIPPASPPHHRSPSSDKSSPSSARGQRAGSVPTTKAYSLPGKFSLSVPVDLMISQPVTEESEGRSIVTVTGDRGGTKGMVTMRAAEVQNAPNAYRQGMAEGMTAEIQDLARASGSTVVEIKGLETAGKIPDQVEFSFVFQDDHRNRTLGGGRLIFGRKRVGIFIYVGRNLTDVQVLKSAAQTYQEL